LISKTFSKPVRLRTKQPDQIILVAMKLNHDLGRVLKPYI